MKEAYLKKKLTELAEEADEIKQQLVMRRNQLDRMEARILDFKSLLKRLDELDSFKETTVKELKQQNQQYMKEVSDELKERNDQLMKKSLEDKSMLLNETKGLLKEDQLLFQEYTQVVREAEMATVFLKEFHHLLLLKLVNKGVFSTRDLSEIKKRAEKRSQSKTK